MIRFITEVGNFIASLLNEILHIPITSRFGQPDSGDIITIGEVIAVIIIISFLIMFFKGGKGD